MVHCQNRKLLNRLFFGNDSLFALQKSDLQHALDLFSQGYNCAGMKISIKIELIVLHLLRKSGLAYLFAEKYLKQVDKVKYRGVTFAVTVRIT